MNFKTYLEAIGGGATAGDLELAKTPLSVARKFASNLYKSQNQDINSELPDFDENYLIAQKLAKLGHTKRFDMPVISLRDVKLFQERLEQGYIDIKDPKSKISIAKEPFPEGLSGEKAKQWLENGLKKYDGSKEDDIVNVSLKNVQVKNLKPIQEQIYFDKVIKKFVKEGHKESFKFIQNSFFICTNDLFIIDGHHRFLSALLQNPDLSVQVLQIDLPISIVLKLTLAYSDAIGNKRNN